MCSVLERKRAFDLAIYFFLKKLITGLGFNGMHNQIYNLSTNKIIMIFPPLN